MFLRKDTSLFPQERFLQSADVRDWSPLSADLISSHETTDLSSNKALPGGERVCSASLHSMQKVSVDAQRKIGLPSVSRQHFNFRNPLEQQEMQKSIVAFDGIVISNVQRRLRAMTAHFIAEKHGNFLFPALSLDQKVTIGAAGCERRSNPNRPNFFTTHLL